MNGSPYALPAFIFLAAVLFGCGAWAFLAITRPSGQHARHRPPNAEAARFGAYLRGEPEPEEQPAPHQPDEPGGGDWWDEPLMEQERPPAVEILAGPGAPIRQTSEVTVRTLARVRDKLLPDAWRPEPGQATFTPAGPDATRTDLPAVQDAPQYLAAPQ